MKDDMRLVTFGLGTFHAVMITLVPLLALYLTVVLGEALTGLNTLLGFAIFGALWATSVYCTSRGMRDAGFQLGITPRVVGVLNNAVTWGAWNGVLFFWCLLGAGIVVLLAVALSKGMTQAGGVVVFGVVAFGAGTIFATFIGAFIGCLLAAIDLVLLALAWRVAGIIPTQTEGVLREEPPLQVRLVDGW